MASSTKYVPIGAFHFNDLLHPYFFAAKTNSRLSTTSYCCFPYFCIEAFDGNSAAFSDQSWQKRVASPMGVCYCCLSVNRS